MRFKKFWDNTRSEEGSAALEFITAGMLLLVPVVYLVLAISAVQGATLATEGAARHAARVYVQAASASLATAHANLAVQAALEDFGIPAEKATVSVACSPNCVSPRSLVTVTVAVNVPLPLVPAVLDLDQRAVVPVSAQASDVVSRFSAGILR
ncbi:hypothetical protein M2119_001552 [Aurantimicrobium minutum]|uniref:hypothetical protein n=1 Tax=Aurantimicrobium minutum TaxID=708131 RepID=UPI0024744588|nr:hypothetical protein [Aurantimicrobium minutum]MDH6533315.1 hypothetical protein [Aurantimicrobium minutum]